MSAPILQLQDIELAIGTTQLFKGVNLSVEPYTRLCMVGQNGSGKSTLMKLIAGLVEADQGEVFIQSGTRIAYMPQEPDFPKGKTAIEYVENQDNAPRHIAEKTLDGLGIAYDKSLDSLSGGEARRVSLAHAMALEPDILMLDEPTNHLDVETIQWLEKELLSFPGALILISHDRTFLANVTTQTFWLDQGLVRTLNKGYGHFEEWAAQIVEEEMKSQAKREKLIEQETQWSRGGISARRKRNQGRLKRLYELRDKRAQQLSYLKMARLDSSLKEESSKALIEAKNISKSYGDRCLVKDFTTRILRGDRIGIIGPNGSGKTTLLKILIGELRPDSGKIKIGKRLDPIYLDQNRATLDPKKTLWETFCPTGGDHIDVQGKQRHVVAYLKEFMFKPEQARSPVFTLSGGEKNRLLLAIALATSSNFMILDEPTNDLDMDTLDRLQDMLCQFEGTLLLVSHDRSFLDNVVTSTIVMEGEGVVQEYAGGYQDYLRQSKKSSLKAKSPKKGPLSKKEKKPDPKEKPRPTKLTFKHQHALKELPKQIEALDKLIADLEMQLGDAGLYQRDSLKAQDLALQLEEAKSKKSDCENEWLKIELLRESLL